jgi:cell division transport system permease protein
MQKVDNRITKRRLRSSYITSIVSISLVLFLLGLIGLLLLNTKKISDYVKENLKFTVYLKDNIREVDILRIQKNLDLKHYVKETEYITKEQAAIEFQKELGEKFIDFLGFNPLIPSIDVRLYAEYANSDSITIIKKDLRKFSQIDEVYYQESLIHLVNKNLRKISIFILIISGLLFLVAVTLINNTIRLSIYSKRFIIRTMQIVGANNSFIRRPFLYKSALHGSFGALIAIAMLTGMIYLIQNEMESIINFQDFKLLSILFIIVLIIGIAISWISTYFAVNRYLNMPSGKTIIYCWL